MTVQPDFIFRQELGLGVEANARENIAQHATPTEPFLRWAGGKRWMTGFLSGPISKRLALSKGRYIEPFLGSGAIFFAVCPERSILNDLNHELIISFSVLRDQPQKVIEKLKSWPVTKEKYYEIRNWKPATKFDTACRFIWLNRTCYGGLHRTNRSGEFNTPYGGGSRVPDRLWERGIALACSANLRRSSELHSGDFEAVLLLASRGDVVFCDPTYSNHDKDHFDRYGANIFSWEDQLRLADACKRAVARGATVVLTNGAYHEIADVYPDAYRIRKTRATTLAKSHRRGTNEEFVFVLDPLRQRKHWTSIGKIENKLKRSIALEAGKA